MITWLVQVGVKGPNAREHHMARARRVKQERAATHGSALVQLRADGMRALAKLQKPLLVKLTRIGARFMDDDNVQGACKAIRDEVAALLGTGDSPTSPVRWEYGQELGEYGVRVEVRSAREAA